MVVSVTGSGVPVFPPGGSGCSLEAAVPFRATHHGETGEDGTDSQEIGSEALGMEALGESFAPEFLPPPDKGKISPVSMTMHSSAHLPRIYRPPIA